MTEYQKKKLIDLVLVIIAIVVVGLFLRTQLSKPIVLEAENTTEEPVEVKAGKIITDRYTTDLYDENAIAIQSIDRNSDAQYLDVQLVLKSFVGIGITDFVLEIEMASDDTYTIVVSSSEGKSLSELIANLRDAFFQNSSEEILSELSVAESENRILIQVPNSNRLNLDASMPMTVSLKYKVDGSEITQIYPEQ